ncbi:hypothetical protein [Sphingomonas kyungheensis]|uniref:Uncharacterized protein n=1 Tax=Sphingomonas kyungheensis TaxID=1069987 RepID=A0ABU8GX10_9SPHN
MVTAFNAPRPEDWPTDARIESWRWIRHPIGIKADGEVVVTPAEVSIYIDGGEGSYAAQLALYSRRYASLFELVQEYRNMRREMEALPVEQSSNQGPLLRGAVAWVASPRAEALSAAIEGAAVLVATQATALAKEGETLASTFVASSRRALKEPTFEVVE